METPVDWMAEPTIQAAAVAGRISAAAAEGQRDLQRCAHEAPELFPLKPFDATLFAAVSAANAFSAPDLPGAGLAMVNRGALWGFAVDWRIDYLAKTVDEVDMVVARCLATAGGAPPLDPLTEFLAQLRDRVTNAPATTAPGGAALLAAWRDELARMLAGMRREWDWRGNPTRPSLDEYIDNADNLGSAFVNLGHWIVTTPDADPADLPAVLAALRAEQKVIRLLNDLGTYRRDLAWGDLNALLLDAGASEREAGRDEVTARVGLLVARTEAALVPLTGAARGLADFLRRQIGFCTGFYGVTDYWGEL
jgi:hypothetical protein